jgi:hypothetical protein
MSSAVVPFGRALWKFVTTPSRSAIATSYAALSERLRWACRRHHRNLRRHREYSGIRASSPERPATDRGRCTRNCMHRDYFQTPIHLPLRLLKEVQPWGSLYRHSVPFPVRPGAQPWGVFSHQVPLAGYICDFVRASRRLVVEVDGTHHSRRAPADARRDAVLARLGYRVLRLDAALVMREVTAAVECLPSPGPRRRLR